MHENFFGRCHTVLGRRHKSFGWERTPVLTGESQLINLQKISIMKDKPTRQASCPLPTVAALPRANASSLGFLRFPESSED